jgi:uncharacterized protein YktA (UPF0223 family)
MNAVFGESVACEIGKLCKEKCRGCEVNHPSQRRQECIMLSEEQRCISYGLEAIERVIERGIVWKQFIEAEHAVKHFIDLGKDHEVTLSLLMNLRQTSDFSDYQAILGIFLTGLMINEHFYKTIRELFS